MTSLYYHSVSIVMLLCLLRDCSANNPDPCSNPANQGTIVPFRQVVIGNTYFTASYHQDVYIYDTTHCYLIIGYYNVRQNEANGSMTFTLGFGGSLSNLCSNQSNTEYFVDLSDTFPTTNSLINASPDLLVVSIAAINVQGSLYNGSSASPISAAFGEMTFSTKINFFSTNQYQTDELATNDTSPCTVRTRSDSASIYGAYSHGSTIDISFSNGSILHFIFPSGMYSIYGSNQAQKYYQQCTCYESTMDTQLTSAEQTRTTPLTPDGKVISIC